MNFIKSCHIQPYQISEKLSKSMYFQNRPNMHKFESITSSDAVAIDVKLDRYTRLVLKRFIMYF